MATGRAAETRLYRKVYTASPSGRNTSENDFTSARRSDISLRLGRIFEPWKKGYRGHLPPVKRFPQ